ncbi:MAG: DUF2188 domain-containing protein [Alphaproteobacteria bacterium]|nr:DUF2188 domain-containing protein [Alphaproteobacteria bacterium]
MQVEQWTDTLDTLADRARTGARRLTERASLIETMAQGLAIVHELGFGLGDPTGRLHVMPNSHGWEVEDEAGSRPPRHFSSKRDAVDHARGLAHEARGLLIIHRETGALQSVYSYVKDDVDAQSAS